MSNVIVGCKLPNGLEIRLGETSVTLNGANSSQIVGGYGLTPVDKDFFDKWAQAYATFAPLKDGLVFAQVSSHKAEAQAKEQAAVKSGLEPLDLAAPVQGVKPEAYEGLA